MWDVTQESRIDKLKDNNPLSNLNTNGYKGKGRFSSPAGEAEISLYPLNVGSRATINVTFCFFLLTYNYNQIIQHLHLTFGEGVFYL